MKKLMLVMICIVLLVGTISADELITFDNIKQYDEETRTITIVNTFGLGRDIATIQLNTPLVFEVPRGYQKVAELTIDSFDDTYKDAFDKMEFYDLRNNEKKFERSFDYKYKVINQVEVEDYETICKNGNTISDFCERILIGTHIEDRVEWLDLDTSILHKGKITIGVFTIRPWC